MVGKLEVAPDDVLVGTTESSRGKKERLRLLFLVVCWKSERGSFKEEIRDLW